MKYVDADVLVYWALDHPDHGDAATRIMRHIEVNEKACTSALSLYLFDSVMAQLDLADYDLSRFLDTVGRLRNLRIEPVNEKTYQKAAELRTEYKVPLDIAAGMAVAADRKADAVYSNNSAWEKGPLPRRFSKV